jgi:hypothetical protein
MSIYFHAIVLTTSESIKELYQTDAMMVDRHFFDQTKAEYGVLVHQKVYMSPTI